MSDLRPYLRAVTGSSKLTIGDRLVFLMLAAYANEDGYAWPKSKTLSDACGMCPNNVRRCLARLVKAGVIAIAERRLGRPTVYRFPLHPSTACAPPGSGDVEQPEPEQAHPRASAGSPLSLGRLTEVPLSTNEEEERAPVDNLIPPWLAQRWADRL